MAYVLVHKSDAARMLLEIANPKSEHYLCGLEIDRYGVCIPGVAFKVQESSPENVPYVPVYIPLSIPQPARLMFDNLYLMML